jgi:hypothetical protein
MNIVTPDTTGSINFSIRPRPTASYSPFIVKMEWQNEETYQAGSQIVTASYNSSDFLNVTASLYMSGSNFYSVQLFQMSGAVQCQELYRGELYATTDSPYVLTSEPFISYTSASTDYIIYQ